MLKYQFFHIAANAEQFPYGRRSKEDVLLQKNAINEE